MEKVFGVVLAISVAIFIKHLLRLYRLLKLILLSAKPMPAHALRSFLASHGKPFGVLGQGRMKEVLLEGILRAKEPITPVLSSLKDAIYSIYRQKKVYSNLNFKRSLSILNGLYKKAKISIAPELVLEVKDGTSIPLRSVRQMRFAQSLGYYQVKKTMRKLGLVQKLLVFINNQMPFRWLFRMINRGVLQSEFIIRDKQKVLIYSEALLDNQGQLTLYGGHCYSTLNQWDSNIQWKIFFGLLKAVVTFLGILLIAYELMVNLRRKRRQMQEEGRLGVDWLSIKECKDCRRRPAVIFQKPCKHSVFCKQCFKQRKVCTVCGQQIESKQQFFLC